MDFSLQQGWIQKCNTEWHLSKQNLTIFQTQINNKKKKTVIFVVYLLKSKCHTRLILKYSCLLQTWQTRQNDWTGHSWLLRRLGELNTLLLDAMKQVLGSLEVPKQKNPNKTNNNKKKRQNNHHMYFSAEFGVGRRIPDSYWNLSKTSLRFVF